MQNLDSTPFPKETENLGIVHYGYVKPSRHSLLMSDRFWFCILIFLNWLLELKEKRKGRRKSKTYPDIRVAEKKRILGPVINYSTEDASWIQVATSPSSLGYLSIFW